MINNSVARGIGVPNYSMIEKESQHDYLLCICLFKKRWHPLLYW
jgi:hypothetical protein